MEKYLKDNSKKKEDNVKKLFLLLLFLMMPFLAGCLIHGEGSTVGYVTTVEDTSLVYGWDTVWFRVETGTYSSMQSQPEAYAILSSNKVLKEQLLETCRNNQKIELIYQKHTASTAQSNDEIIGFKIIK